MATQLHSTQRRPSAASLTDSLCIDLKAELSGGVGHSRTRMESLAQKQLD